MISNSTSIVPVARGAAAFLGAGCPRATALSGAADIYVPARTKIPGSAVVTPRTAKLAVVPGAPAFARPLAVKHGLPLTNNRNQYVQMTRVIAGGEGAMGPHPEREPV